jgi:branched-chain amino acid transport system ATP-binding protein
MMATAAANQAGEAALFEARGVSKRFGGLAAVSNVSFGLRRGEILGIIGPNGSGKTTLVNVLTGATSYSAGDATLGGRSLRGLPPHRISRLGVGRTFQVVKPFRSLTVLENVMVGGLFGRDGGTADIAAARARAAETLDLCGLAHRSSVAADSLNVPERKRLELARALAMRPVLLFLDEVMAGLNTGEIKEAVDLVKRIRDSGVTLVVIEHVMKAIRSLCDRVLVLYNGETLTEGSPAEVLNHPAVLSAYLGRRYRAQPAPPAPPDRDA